jgi:hypothetical protein
MPDGEFDPQKTRACMVIALLVAGMATAIIYAPFWKGILG